MNADQINFYSADIESFTKMLFVISLFLIGGAFLWKGFDFTIGVLIGSSIVGLNFLWTKNVVRKAFQADNTKIRLGISYGIKIGLTAVVIYIAILQFQVDPFGIIIGTSSLFLTGLIFALVKLSF